MGVRRVGYDDPRAISSQLNVVAHPKKEVLKEAAPKETAVKQSPAPPKEQEASRARPAAQPRVPGMENAGTRLYRDEEAHLIVAQILDEEKEVIRQIPSEESLEVLDVSRRLRAVLFDQIV